jgi:RNA-directed DNA polymerase
MSSRTILARNLAAAFLAGAWSPRALAGRGATACGKRHRWLTSLARRAHAAFPNSARPPSDRSLTAFLLADKGFQRAWARHCALEENLLQRVYWSPAAMAPTAWPVPALASPAALAEWLGLDLGELDWFADCQRREPRSPPGPLRHYTYRWRTTRGKARLLEVPKSRLKAVQRRLLHELLDHVPAHDAAHGYCRGRSLVTYVAPHAGQRIVLHFDLREFFPSVSSARVRALFRTVGYPETVARLLTGLCTNSVPADALDARPVVGAAPAEGARRRLSFPHLPQGAPTSPALANLCAHRLDCRLAGLARSAGAAYTRYADDLVFSGDEALERCARNFHVHVCRIALEEGFEVNTRKSHFMRQGVRQQVAGVVLNVRPNVRRREVDRLKAILTNCVRQGPQGQDREGRVDFRLHLAGRIAHVAQINPARGERLRRLFEQIAW